MKILTLAQIDTQAVGGLQGIQLHQEVQVKKVKEQRIEAIRKTRTITAKDQTGIDPDQGLMKDQESVIEETADQDLIQEIDIGGDLLIEENL